MSDDKKQPYRVLARKYRPQNFDELIGQDALVRTLKNAIESGRVAHAFMLTGVRGVGKTTTARIIAKALNYTGPDGKAGPTIGATNDCTLCKAISEDRHPDVIEMDAASRTGIDDIREILDGVRYAPTEARYKVYIIDEVHMLSRQAFNALLKTLEEPPEHVKFIFATTEIRKVPVTVLSRCQRFDLRRVDVPTLVAHFKNICDKENVTIEDSALSAIARAADGSVRDGLSLLDQAMAMGGDSITAKQIENMLGLVDRARGLDLLECALTGDIKDALSIMDDLYKGGCDPLVLMQDLLDLTHILTRLRAVPGAENMKYAMAAGEVSRAADLATRLSMPTLGKTWQILLKGLGEVQAAPNPQSAAEMVLIRLVYAADLPDPATLLKKLKEGPSNTSGSNSSSAGLGPREPAPSAMRQTSSAAVASAALPSQAPLAAAQAHTHEHRALSTLEDIVALLQEYNEFLLASQIFQYAHLVKLESMTEGGRLELRPDEHAPPKMAQDLGARLGSITGQRWVVSISSQAGLPTLAEQKQATEQAELTEILEMPVMRDIMQAFPDAKIIDIQRTENKKEEAI